MEKTLQSFNAGDYRWVAEVGKHLVFNNPDNQDAKNLLADAYEQLGYQAESGPWRSVYLQGAFELRNGVPTSGGTKTDGPDVIRAMTPEMVFDYLAIRLNYEKAEGADFSIQVDFTDLGESHELVVKNAVLNHSQHVTGNSDVKLKMSMATMNRIQLGETTLRDAVNDGSVELEGDAAIVENFFAMLDEFSFWFNIVTP
jgi:alkyl sulfatase BDS1-like metallo-beta-lactamase superfamily hydrolase